MSRFIQCDGPECDEVMKDFGTDNIEGWILADCLVGRPVGAQDHGRTVSFAGLEVPMPPEVSDKFEGQFHSWECLSDWARQQAVLWEASVATLG